MKDLEKSIEFYTKLLGMKLGGRSKIEASKGKVTNLVSLEGRNQKREVTRRVNCGLEVSDCLSRI